MAPSRKRRRADKADRKERKAKRVRSRQRPALPEEIRIRIWQTWANNLEPRIVKVRMLSYDVDGHEHHTFMAREPVPAIFCSWDLMDQRQSTIYFSLDRDTLYFGPPTDRKWDDKGRRKNNLERERTSSYDPHELDYSAILRCSRARWDLDDGPWKSSVGWLKNLAVWLCQHSPNEWEHFIRNVSNAAPRLSSLVLVVKELIPPAGPDHLSGILWYDSWRYRMQPQCRYQVEKALRTLNDWNVHEVLEDKHKAAGIAAHRKWLYTLGDEEKEELMEQWRAPQGAPRQALLEQWRALHHDDPYGISKPPQISVRIYRSTEEL
ncbi:hypothetical protein DL95DRAFT_481302 [Leptodontidium sp. 2 PMI_412]|nr:hypothetical protein BKA61DRAFT_565811 [Leptodontidium sp. MPI-SDFR-AT-0119]KAH9220240.1 hypothetical protein DL95DRAFT_481302 [Leptodontidium sp. 2 PMI_412]